MKKRVASILSIAAAFLFAFQMMADDTYGIHYINTTWVPGYWENPATGERSDTWRSGWTRVPGYFDTKGAWHLPYSGAAYEALKDSSLSLDIVKNDTDSGFSYGTFQYDSGTGQVVANSEVFIGSVGAGELGSGVSVAYSAGDLAGVWVEVEGVKYYSRLTLNPNLNTGTYLGTAPEGFAYLWFYDDANWPGHGLNVSIKILVTGVPPASSGTPLPGVLTTMALCGAVGGYFRRKKSVAHEEQE